MKTAAFNWLLGLICASAAAFLIPRADPFPFVFKEGQVWNYEDLYAPFDFETAPAPGDADTATAPSAAYYTVDVSLPRLLKNELNDLIRKQVMVGKNDAQYQDMIENSGAYAGYGEALIDAIYQNPIVETHPGDGMPVVLIAAAAQQTVSDRLITVAEALEIATDSLPYSPLRQPELLAPMIEKILVPNTFFSDSLTAVRGGIAPGSTHPVHKGDLIVGRKDVVSKEIWARLKGLQQRLRQSEDGAQTAGYWLFCLLAFGAVMSWMQFYKKSAFQHRNKVLLALVCILCIQLLAFTTHRLGAAVPLLLPLYLLPLLLKPVFGLRTAVVIWSAPVMMTGFGLEWGMIWMTMQATAAGVALLLNDRVHTWSQRIGALGLIVATQATVWLSALLTQKAPEALRHTDVLVFLSIGALLSLGQSVIMRFVAGVKSEQG